MLDFFVLLAYNNKMKNYIKKPWSIRERILLKEKYNSYTEEELLEAFPGRTYNSIRKQVSYLRKRGWTFNAKSKSQK